MINQWIRAAAGSGRQGERSLKVGRPDLKKVGRRYPLLMHGEAFVASFGAAVAVIFLGALASASWWTTRSQRTAMIESRAGEVRAVAQMLARSAEALMLSDRLSPLRRLVVEASHQHRLARCRIVLPDGEVVADFDPTRITVKALRDKWPVGDVGPASETRHLDQIALRYPLKIAGRGTARLEMAAAVNDPHEGTWQVQAGIGTIGAVALVALLFVYRHVRTRLHVVVMIREALLAYQGEQTPIELLGVSSDFGREATAWNDLLAQSNKLRSKKLDEEVREVLDAPQRASSHLHEACDTMSQGIVLVDETLCVRYANGAAAVFAQADRQKIIDTPIDQIFHEQSVLDAVRFAADSAARRRSVAEVRRADRGDPTVLRFSVRPVRRSDPVAVMIVIDDVTQQRVAEQARNDFVAQVAHELRAPLSNIRLYVESLMSDDQDEPLRVKSINVINLETRRLARLVSDMLSVAEIESGAMRVQSDDIHLAGIFQELEADYKPQAMEKNICLKFILPPKLPVIQADRDKLVMAMHNLVGNAVKYTSEDGQVDVGVQIASDRFVMEVSDTGIGISDQDQQKIFEKFYRARDERMASIPGTGLGLSLAREVVRLHGGDITVESEHGKGSTFTLSLPVQVEAA